MGDTSSQVKIDTSRPRGIKATDGTTTVVVHKEQLLDAQVLPKKLLERTREG